MVLQTRKIGRTEIHRKENENENDACRRLPDLPPEYCTYQDEGCDHADSCLECPFPHCLYDTPRGRQRWSTRSRNRGLRRLSREGWKVRELAVLVPGCSLAVSPGCVTPAGKESSDGLSFRLERLEHVSAGGIALLRLHGRDARASLAEWTARRQFRWNRTAGQTCVRDIIAAVLARAGISLEVVSASDAATGLYPEFTLSPGADGRAALRRLLLDVPDVLFFEGTTAYLLNPQPDDEAVYFYGVDHPVFEANYLAGALPLNRVRVEGLDASGIIIADTFDWDELAHFPYRSDYVADRNMATAADAADLGAARLRQGELASSAGSVVVMPNCGQQLFDVVGVTDPRAGLDGLARRVTGITLTWDTHRGLYRQRLDLGPV